MATITDEDTGELDAEDVFCSKCGDAEATDDNDILLCDGFCERAFHQRCVVPHVREEDIPPGDEVGAMFPCSARADITFLRHSCFLVFFLRTPQLDLFFTLVKCEWYTGRRCFSFFFSNPSLSTCDDSRPYDEGWLCQLCDARVDSFYTLNMDFELNLDPATASWTEVFPEEAELDARGEGPGQPNEEGGAAGAKDAQEEDWPDDEDDDVDFAAGDVSDDGADDEDEPLSAGAHNRSVPVQYV